jgi:integrase
LALTALKVKSLGPGRHTDAHGLHLYVRENGSRTWVLRFGYKGRRRDYCLGPAYDISLAEARALAAEIRSKVRGGGDPIRERALIQERPPTFAQVTRECYEAMKGGWKNGEHESWLPSFENHVFPLIGRKAIDQVDSAAVLKVLEPIWLTIGPTARRILQRIGTVLDFAHIKKYIAQEVSLRSVTRGLPRQNHQVTHRKAMAHADVPSFWSQLAELPNTLARDALKLAILTATRSNEVRFAVWREFDLETGVWSIPAARMKTREPHAVPLSEGAVALVRRLRAERRAIDGDMDNQSLVFTYTGKSPISDMTVLKVLRDMQLTDVTVHGFRSTFTDWAAECTDFPKEVADKALSHRVPNAVEAAYRRTDFFEKRRQLMSLWAQFVTR